MRTLTVIALFALVCPVAAQESLTVLKDKEGTPPRKMLATYLQAEAQKHFDARRSAVGQMKTPEDVQGRQMDLRVKFIESIGGFPSKTPLRAQVVGTEQRAGYRIERVVYESRPNHHVTATLYLPDSKTPVPGVLMPIGHSNNGKAADYIQRGCILLAKNGLAALTYDPIGQGERRQLLDNQGKPAIPSSTSEHTLCGVGALLIGRNTASYRIWDGIRSIDYLTSRPEIDPKRIGCTGCSGGGTLTSYLMALDDRIVAAAPSCYITSLERLFATIGPQDAEQNITGQVAFGMEHADYLTLRAPRPTLICAASRDFFDIQGTWTTFREAKLVYGLMGHGERVDLVEFNTGHGYPKPQREAVVRWMRRWLLEKDDAPVESDFAIARDAQLYCTRTGQVLEDLKGKSVFDLNGETDRELTQHRARAVRSPDEMRKEIRRLIALRPVEGPIRRTDQGEVKRDGYAIHKYVYHTEPGIAVPVLFFRPAKVEATTPVILYVHDLGKHTDAAAGGPIEKLVKAGNQVLALDPRGLGETAPGVLSGKGPSYFGTDFKETYLGLHLNRPLLGQRIYDVLAVADCLAGDADTSRAPIHIIGIGNAGPIALHAAALDGRIKQVTLDRSLVSWSAVARTPITHNQLTNVVPGALGIYDLPDLATLIAPRPLTIQATVDAVNQPVTQAVMEEAYAGAKAAYAKQKATQDFRLQVSR